jgi:hypothetical protein
VAKEEELMVVEVGGLLKYSKVSAAFYSFKICLSLLAPENW